MPAPYHSRFYRPDALPVARRSTTVVYRTDRQALSTAQFCRAAQLATAATCTLNFTAHFTLKKNNSGAAGRTPKAYGPSYIAQSLWPSLLSSITDAPELFLSP